MNMQKIFILFSGLCVLTGCSYTGVKTLGAGVYEVTNHGLTLGQSPETLRTQALTEAKAYCRNKGLAFDLIEADEEGGGYGKLPESDVQFRCEKPH